MQTALEMFLHSLTRVWMTIIEIFILGNLLVLIIKYIQYSLTEEHSLEQRKLSEDVFYYVVSIILLLITLGKLSQLNFLN